MAEDAYTYFQPERVAPLRNLNLLARQVVEGFISGLHRSPHKGFSVEFAEHREYAAGDDTRHLDWTAWARTDRYYIKQYEQETNLRATILLDVSNSMAYRHGGAMTKFEYACSLAACLAYLMCRQQDVVGLTAFDEAQRLHLPPASTPAHLDRLFKALEALRPGRSTAIASTFHALADGLAKRGLIIVLSDLYDEPAEILRSLQHFVYKRHQIIVFHLMDPAELDLPFRKVTTFVDMETGRRVQVDPAAVRETYVREVEQFIETYRRECADRKIEYVLARTDTPFDRMLLDYLARRKAMSR